MVLPGVSGGYLLLILGQYVAVLAAIELLKNGLQGRDFSMVGDAMNVVIPVGIGVLIGIAAVSNLIKVLLDKFPRPTLGALLGLLLGAVIGLWPFQHGVPPEVGSIFRGDTVALIDNQLVMQQTGRVIEPEKYDTAFFAPGFWQIAGALGIIGGGFGASMLIARIGGGRKKA